MMQIISARPVLPAQGFGRKIPQIPYLGRIGLFAIKKSLNAISFFKKEAKYCKLMRLRRTVNEIPFILTPFDGIAIIFV